jgi:hypothetical protein
LPKYTIPMGSRKTSAHLFYQFVHTTDQNGCNFNSVTPIVVTRGDWEALCAVTVQWCSLLQGDSSGADHSRNLYFKIVIQKGKDHAKHSAETTTYHASILFMPRCAARPINVTIIIYHTYIYIYVRETCCWCRRRPVAEYSRILRRYCCCGWHWPSRTPDAGRRAERLMHCFYFRRPGQIIR